MVSTFRIALVGSVVVLVCAAVIIPVVVVTTRRQGTIPNQSSATRTSTVFNHFADDTSTRSTTTSAPSNRTPTVSSQTTRGQTSKIQHEEDFVFLRRFSKLSAVTRVDCSSHKLLVFDDLCFVIASL